MKKILSNEQLMMLGKVSLMEIRLLEEDYLNYLTAWSDSSKGEILVLAGLGARGSDGIVFETESAEEMPEYLAKLIQEYDIRIPIQYRGQRGIVGEKFEIETMIEDLLLSENIFYEQNLKSIVLNSPFFFQEYEKLLKFSKNKNKEYLFQVDTFKIENVEIPSLEKLLLKTKPEKIIASQSMGFLLSLLYSKKLYEKRTTTFDEKNKIKLYGSVPVAELYQAGKDAAANFLKILEPFYVLFGAVPSASNGFAKFLDFLKISDLTHGFLKTFIEQYKTSSFILEGNMGAITKEVNNYRIEKVIPENLNSFIGEINLIYSLNDSVSSINQIKKIIGRLEEISFEGKIKLIQSNISHSQGLPYLLEKMPSLLAGFFEKHENHTHHVTKFGKITYEQYIPFGEELEPLS